MTSALVRQGRVGRGSVVLGVLACWQFCGSVAVIVFNRYRPKVLRANRPELAKTTLKLIQQAPVVGGGAGTYQWRFWSRQNVYTMHTTTTRITTIWKPCRYCGWFVPPQSAVFFLMRRLPHGACVTEQLTQLWHRPTARRLCGSSYTRTADFNFQIPANALTFVIAATGSAAADRTVVRHK